MATRERSNASRWVHSDSQSTSGAEELLKSMSRRCCTCYVT